MAPTAIGALLRGYLERGRIPAESLAALTLPELIERVYPSRVSPQRPRRTKGRRKPRRPPDEQPADKQAVGRLDDAFGIAALVGTIGACVGFGLSIAYYRNLPPSPSSYYGDIVEGFLGLFKVTIAGALVSSTLAYFWALWRFDLFGNIPAEKIGCAFAALLAPLLLLLLVVSGL